MSIDVELPSLGESVYEGTISRWLVAEGDAVETDQPIVEVTTDKVDAEIPAPSAGVIEKILVEEGAVVEVGSVLARIDPDAEAKTGGETRERRVKLPEETEAASAAESDASGAVREVAESGRGSSAGESSGESSGESADEIAATPVARRVADEARVDLRSVRGTGSGGRVTKEDVLRHRRDDEEESQDTQPSRDGSRPSSRQAPAAAASPGARSSGPSFDYAIQPGDRVVPMSPMRRIIAEHMVYSKRTSPHVGTVAEADLSRVVKLRREHKQAFEQNHGVSLTFLPFIIHATVRALREYPALNASVAEDTIIEKQDIHIGVATETEKGLVVPVIRQADRLSLAGIAMAIHDLSTRAREKRLSADDLRGGTFTVSNPGRQGNLYGFAIINQPQVGILRMGEIAKRPVVRSVGDDDAIVIRTMMYLALSYDHRAVDGAPANGFLHRICEALEQGEFDL